MGVIHLPSVHRIVVRMIWSGVFGGVLIAGFFLLWTHEQAAGEWHAPPAAWPNDCRLPLKPGEVRVVLFAHPRCPCTRASLSELERVLARQGGKASACVVFHHPSSQPKSWVESTAWRTACRIPGVHVVADQDGVETRRFQAATSGMTVVYGPEGDLLFAGGITPSRGHEGRNHGTDAIAALLARQPLQWHTTCVYGCSLFSRPQSPSSSESLGPKANEPCRL